MLYLVLPYLLYFSPLYLFLSCYIMRILYWMSPAISFLFLYACTHKHDFLCMLMPWIYRYTCAHFCTPSGIHFTTRWGSSDSSGSSCPGPGAWTEGDLLAEDQVYFCGADRSAVAPVPSLLPLDGSRLLQLSRERPFVLFIYVHLFVFSHLRLSVM